MYSSLSKLKACIVLQCQFHAVSELYACSGIRSGICEGRTELEAMLCRRAALSRSVRVPWTLHAMTPENAVHVKHARAAQCRSASGVATSWHEQISRRLNSLNSRLKTSHCAVGWYQIFRSECLERSERKGTTAPTEILPTQVGKLPAWAGRGWAGHYLTH